jgi:hypothetical protein
MRWLPPFVKGCISWVAVTEHSDVDGNGRNPPEKVVLNTPAGLGIIDGQRGIIEWIISKYPRLVGMKSL